jgi:hypothetical protein
MLFHITHTHTPEDCPAHNPEQIKATFGQMVANAETAEINLIGAYVDIPAHEFYLIVEADRIEQVNEMMDPALEIGYGEVRPVVDALITLRERIGED